jgi:dCMP deaminase
MNRINWDEYFVTLAFVASLRSVDEFRKVGAICASRDNRILSCGYNGLAAGFEAPEGLYEDREKGRRNRFLLTQHAEINALSLCRPGEVHTLATTCSPCSNCATIIAGFKVKRVLMIEEYHIEQSYKEVFDFYKIEFKVIVPPDIFKDHSVIKSVFPGVVNHIQE